MNKLSFRHTGTYYSILKKKWNWLYKLQPGWTLEHSTKLNNKTQKYKYCITLGNLACSSSLSHKLEYCFPGLKGTMDCLRKQKMKTYSCSSQNFLLPAVVFAHPLNTNCCSCIVCLVDKLGVVHGQMGENNHQIL